MDSHHCIVQSGKHRGKTFSDVVSNDREYCQALLHVASCFRSLHEVARPKWDNLLKEAESARADGTSKLLQEGYRPLPKEQTQKEHQA